MLAVVRASARTPCFVVGVGAVLSTTVVFYVVWHRRHPIDVVCGQSWLGSGIVGVQLYGRARVLLVCVFINQCANTAVGGMGWGAARFSPCGFCRCQRQQKDNQAVGSGLTKKTKTNGSFLPTDNRRPVDSTSPP